MMNQPHTGARVPTTPLTCIQRYHQYRWNGLVLWATDSACPWMLIIDSKEHWLRMGLIATRSI